MVSGETTNVVVDRSAFLDGRHDRCEVVVEKDQVGRLLGDLGAAPHCDPDVGLLQGGSVIHPVSGHCDDLAESPEHLRETKLLFRVDAREDHVAL